jgi:hypothetical protein
MKATISDLNCVGVVTVQRLFGLEQLVASMDGVPTIVQAELKCA